MKIFKITLFLFIISVSCNIGNPAQHPSFAEIQDFFESEKRIKTLNISDVKIDKFGLTEYRKSENNRIEKQSFQAQYELRLMGDKDNYKSKVVLVSKDNINWNIDRITIVSQADSVGKHYEKTMAWENMDSATVYNVTLRVSHWPKTTGH